MEAWRSGIHGANGYSELSDADLEAARAYGITVFRLGAVGTDNDFRYLVDQQDQWRLSTANLDRLQRTIDRFGQHGFKVILALSSVPGRLWHHKTTDVRIFQSEKYRQDFAQGWTIIAGRLRSDPAVIGYDLMNEPVLPEEAHDQAVNYRELAATIPNTPEDINALYGRTVSAIRSVDPTTPIILEPTHWANPAALPLLKPSSDPRIIYSVHYYQPRVYYVGKAEGGALRYPGPIPAGGPIWDFTRHHDTFARLNEWCLQNHIPAFRIFVGEFGVWKDAIGATDYLRDLVSIFGSYRWSWTYYAFRKDTYPHSDLELEGQRETRSDTPLFDIVRSQFQ